MNLMLASLSGIFLALAFPKFNLFWLAWVALAPFFFVLLRPAKFQEQLFYGLVFGLFFYGLHVFWVTALWRFVGWWVLLGWGAMVLYQTSFLLLFVLLCRFCPWRNTLTLALFWVFMEWLRNLGFVGGAATELGYSQAGFLPLIQVASFSLVYGVSFLVVLVNAALAQLIGAPQRWRPLAAAIILVGLALTYGNFTLNQQTAAALKTIQFALIQPALDQQQKLETALISQTFDLHKKLTLQAAAQHPQVVVWPETAIFTYLPGHPALWPQVLQLARDTQAWLIIGTPYFDGRQAYNSIVVVSPQGALVSRYDKQRLVPFGEYLPLRKLLFPLLQGAGYFDTEYSGNPNAQVLRAGALKIAPAICFESTFPDLVAKNVRLGADIILTVTNDAWFGNSSALSSHLNAGVFRAIENRKYFIQVGNSGISAVIDPYGRVLKQSRVNEQTILTFQVPHP